MKEKQALRGGLNTLLTPTQPQAQEGAARADGTLQEQGYTTLEPENTEALLGTIQDPEMRAHLEELSRRQKVRKALPGDSQRSTATMRVRSELLHQIAWIAREEGVRLADIYEQAFSKWIANYEKSTGKKVPADPQRPTPRIDLSKI